MLRSKWVAGLAVAGLVGSLGVSTAGVAQANPAEPVVVTHNLFDQEPGVAVDLSGPTAGGYGISGPGYTIRYIQPFVAESSGVASANVNLSTVGELSESQLLGSFALYPAAPLGTFNPDFFANSEPMAYTPATLQSGSAVGKFDIAVVAGQQYVLVFTTERPEGGGYDVAMAPATDNDDHYAGTQLVSSTENSGYADYPYFPATSNHPSIKVTTSPIASLDSSNRPLVNVDGTRWLATAGGAASVSLTPSCVIELPECGEVEFSLEGLSGTQRFASTPVTLPNSNGATFQWYVDVALDNMAPSFYVNSYERSKNAITVDFVCTDEGSGVAPSELCDELATFPRGSVDRTETIIVNDLAGNGSVSELSIPALRTAVPVIMVTGVQDGKTYPYGSTVKPTCTATSSAVRDLRAQQTTPDSPVPCSGVTTSTKNSNGSVSYKYVATATDNSDVDGGTATATVRWTVAAKPVAPAPKPVAKPVLSVSGFGSATYKGVPKVKLGQVYSNTIRVTVNCRTMVTKGAPVWLKSVPSNASGTVGKPATKSATLSKTNTPGVWKKKTSFGQLGFRKFGIKYPNGVVVYKVVYVVR